MESPAPEPAEAGPGQEEPGYGHGV